MRILIIGNGLISASIVERLESENNEILVFSRTFAEKIKCHQILGDIFDFEKFIKVLDWKPQIIIHTAWITTPGIYTNDLSNFQYAHFSIKLAKYLTYSNVEHLIILGTCAEYGNQIGPSTAGFTKLSPATLYAQQKVVAFTSVKEILQRSDMRLTWARIFYPYGPNQHHQRLIPYLINALKNGDSIILSDTTSIHDWITTRDIASAISWVISNNVPLEIDIGTSFGFTNLQLLITLEKLLQINIPLPSRGGMHNLGLNQVFVTSKNSPLFISGWSPVDSLNSGLEWVVGK